jgi:hypothetical protein
VAPGCVFVILRDAEQELALYALNIDLHMPFLSVMPALSDGFPTERESVLSMARRMDRPSDPIGPRPVANGLFVVYSGPWDWR